LQDEAPPQDVADQVEEEKAPRQAQLAEGPAVVALDHAAGLHLDLDAAEEAGRATDADAGGDAGAKGVLADGPPSLAEGMDDAVQGGV